jgi:hypothetical protein
MSTVVEVKKATEQLSSKDRWELFVWLRESEDVRTHQLQELQRDLAVGLQQADRGEVAPLDISSIRAKIHLKLKESAQS